MVRRTLVDIQILYKSTNAPDSSLNDSKARDALPNTLHIVISEKWQRAEVLMSLGYSESLGTNPCHPHSFSPANKTAQPLDTFLHQSK